MPDGARAARGAAKGPSGGSPPRTGAAPDGAAARFDAQRRAGMPIDLRRWLSLRGCDLGSGTVGGAVWPDMSVTDDTRGPAIGGQRDHREHRTAAHPGAVDSPMRRNRMRWCGAESSSSRVPGARPAARFPGRPASLRGDWALLAWRAGCWPRLAGHSCGVGGYDVATASVARPATAGQLFVHPRTPGRAHRRRVGSGRNDLYRCPATTAAGNDPLDRRAGGMAGSHRP